MKHKVIGLFAVYTVYSTMGLFGVYLRAGDIQSQPALPKPLPGTPAQPVSPPPPQRVVGQFGQPLPDPVGQRQPGQFGGKFGGFGGQFGGQFGGKFGGIGGQIDIYGRKHIAIEDGTTQLLATTQAAPTPPAKSEFVNPKVEPGKVKWHADFDAACKAAAKSGKPVLLFQMMGKLDDQFC